MKKSIRDLAPYLDDARYPSYLRIKCDVMYLEIIVSHLQPIWCSTHSLKQMCVCIVVFVVVWLAVRKDGAAIDPFKLVNL